MARNCLMLCRALRSALSFGWVTGLGWLFFTAPLAGAPVDFLRDIRPILSSHCFKCHGPDEETRKGRLRLDLRDEALRPAKSGQRAIIPGDAAQSELIRRIQTTDEDDLMPPSSTKHPLTETQKELLSRWVAEGAEYRPHWAFEKPKPPARPAVQQAAWPQNEIDYFVLARLEREGLQPSPRADRPTLARRLFLDLTGLPPTPAQAAEFINDPSPQAYERLVDRLLASPHYGERWARRWLDLARYADTNGYEKDRPRSIWPYRDWVIQALNNDLPFDQFTIEQLAGDLLPAASTDQVVATGFHRNTMINEEGGIDPLEFRFHAMVDRVHVTATTWLGLTMACAQCHTHKYDPIQHSEYYQFMAFLNNADEPVFPVTRPDVTEKRSRIERQIAELEASLADRFPPESSLSWFIPARVAFRSQNGAEGTLLDDGSIRVGGAAPDQDVYELIFETPPPSFTHLQVEAIPDEKVGQGGPGRTDHGNFVLTEVILTQEGAAGSTPIPLAGAEADFSQEGFPPEHAIDGKPATGWAVAATENKRFHRRATFRVAKPVEALPGTSLKLILRQEYGGKHTLGRFRVSFGSDHFAGESAAQRGQRHLERQFARWLHSELGTAVRWESLRPLAATSQVPVLTIQSDRSIFASGDFTKNDTYHLRFQLPAGAHALRLEAVPDDRLPKRGPGAVYYEGPEGDFFLSNLRMQAGGKTIRLTNATESFASGESRAGKALDGDLQSGWSINGGQGRTHYAVFQLAEPMAAGTDIELDLTFERYYAAGLGRFRLWVSSDANARASGLSTAATEALLRQRDRLDQLAAAGSHDPDRATLLREFLRVAPELAGARKEIETLRASLPEHPTTLVLRERPPGYTRATYRHHRGEFLQPKEALAPGIPAFLPGLPPGEVTNRLGFARWLVSPENPLTARVVMNRHWEAFFGRGLVRTAEDFGFQGELPSHPELLDWLALEFIRQGWSQKSLHKMIVMSATYQQRSQAAPEALARDPLNILLGRGARFRLEAELVRDGALVAAGLFTERLGGPSVFPPQPGGVSTEGAYGALQWQTSTGPDRFRRGLYTFAKRTAPYAMTATFDGPSGEACLARRDRSNTPLQALTLLNDEVFLECARALGQWASGQTASPGELVSQLFQRCLTRPPSEPERAKLLAFYHTQLERFRSGEMKADELLGATLEKAHEAAAWTALARVLLNLDEAITKS